MQMIEWKTRPNNLASLHCLAWIALFTMTVFPQSVIGQTSNAGQPAEVDEPGGFGFKELSHLGGVPPAKSPDNYQATIRRITSPTSDDRDQSDELDLSQTGLNSDRVKSIQERIKLLERLMAEESTSNAAPKATPADQSPTTMAAEANPRINLPKESFPLPPEQDVVPNSSNGDPLNTDVETKIPLPSVTGTPVTAQPVNSFELGNSLFLTGNLTASRKSYESSLKHAQSPEEDAWLRCLIGCCYRLEGDLANAETMYREVTQHKNQTYPVDYAKWCLQYVEQKRTTQEQFRLIESEIEIIKKELGKQ